MFFLVFLGAASPVAAFVDFFVPVLIGNTVGGVVFVALVLYAMTAERRLPDPACRRPELSVPEWLFGRLGRARGEPPVD